MLNYIGSELYKTFRRKYTKIALAVIALLCIAGNALVRMVFSMAGTLDSAYPFYLGIMLMPMCFALLTIVVDAVFSDEYKYGTLKNTISFGISRAEIYFGKLIVEIILMLSTIALVLVVYTASGLLFSQIGAHGAIEWQAVRLFLGKNRAFPAAVARYARYSEPFGVLIPQQYAFRLQRDDCVLLPRASAWPDEGRGARARHAL